MAKRRFFYHYRRSTGGMTVHFRGKCISCTDVKCLVPCETHRNKTQPHLVLRGYASSVRLDGDTCIIE